MASNDQEEDAMARTDSTENDGTSLTPQIDVVDGIKFLSWESGEDIERFTKIESLNKSSSPQGCSTRLSRKNGSRSSTDSLTKSKDWSNKKLLNKRRLSCNTRLNKSPNSSSNNEVSLISSTCSRSLDFGNIDGDKVNRESKTGNILKDNRCLNSSIKLNSYRGTATYGSLINRSSNMVRKKYLKQQQSSSLNDSVSDECINIRRGRGRPKKNSTSIKEPTKFEIHTEISAPGVNYDLLERLYNEYMEKIFLEQSKKNKTDGSFTMDENFVTESLRTLTPSLFKKDESNTQVTKLDVSAANDDTLVIVRPPSQSKNVPQESETDLTTTTSRHPKREIRLPSRYHQSGLILGSQWVIPEIDSGEKQNRKRLRLEDSTSLDKLESPNLQSAEISSGDLKIKKEPAESSQSENIKLSVNSECISEGKVSPTVQRLKTSDDNSTIPPSEVLDKDKKNGELEKGEQIEDIVVKTEGSLSQSSSINKVEKPHINPESSQHFILLTDLMESEKPCGNKEFSSSLINQSASKDSKLAVLRELYRCLYFENKPERRLIYAKSRVKPRVNKQDVVKEGIQVIEKLNKRKKQLEYLKELLAMWNKKLSLAAKVINQDGLIPKAVEVVQEVLKAYRASKGYRVSEALNTSCKPVPISISPQDLTKNLNKASEANYSTLTLPVTSPKSSPSNALQTNKVNNNDNEQTVVSKPGVRTDGACNVFTFKIDPTKRTTLILDPDIKPAENINFGRAIQINPPFNAAQTGVVFENGQLCNKYIPCPAPTPKSILLTRGIRYNMKPSERPNALAFPICRASTSLLPQASFSNVHLHQLAGLKAIRFKANGVKTASPAPIFEKPGPVQKFFYRENTPIALIPQRVQNSCLPTNNEGLGTKNEVRSDAIGGGISQYSPKTVIFNSPFQRKNMAAS